jgi:hypothetical protein
MVKLLDLIKSCLFITVIVYTFPLIAVAMLIHWLLHKLDPATADYVYLRNCK